MMRDTGSPASPEGRRSGTETLDALGEGGRCEAMPRCGRFFGKRM